MPFEFQVQRIVNAGFVGRNREAVLAHVKELEHEGVAPPPSIPMVFPVLKHNITTENEIEVMSSKTSGEVEYTLFLNGKDIFVGIGSDHTDRALEAQSMTKSKQICQNVVSKNVWNLKEIESDWDSLWIQSWVKETENSPEVLYQDSTLGTIISPQDLIQLVRSKMKNECPEGLIIFSGTVPIKTEKMVYGTHFRCKLTHPKSKKSLDCEYRIRFLNDMRDMEIL